MSCAKALLRETLVSEPLVVDFGIILTIPEQVTIVGNVRDISWRNMYY
jgi:hypothetical protein